MARKWSIKTFIFVWLKRQMMQPFLNCCVYFEIFHYIYIYVIFVVEVTGYTRLNLSLYLYCSRDILINNDVIRLRSGIALSFILLMLKCESVTFLLLKMMSKNWLLIKDVFVTNNSVKFYKRISVKNHKHTHEMMQHFVISTLQNLVCK